MALLLPVLAVSLAPPAARHGTRVPVEAHGPLVFAQALIPSTNRTISSNSYGDDGSSIPDGCYDFPDSYFDTGDCGSGVLYDCSSSWSVSDSGSTLKNVQKASSCIGCGTCTGTTVQTLSYSYSGSVEVSGTDVSYSGEVDGDCDNIKFTPAHGTFSWSMDGSDVDIGGTTLSRNYFGGMGCIVFLGLSLGAVIGIGVGIIVAFMALCYLCNYSTKSRP